jgi:hypothetical protein
MIVYFYLHRKERKPQKMKHPNNSEQNGGNFCKWFHDLRFIKGKLFSKPFNILFFNDLTKYFHPNIIGWNLKNQSVLLMQNNVV